MCVCVCVYTGRKVKEQEDVSSQTHTSAPDSGIIYYNRNEYREMGWGRTLGQGAGLHTQTHTDK